MAALREMFFTTFNSKNPSKKVFHHQQNMRVQCLKHEICVTVKVEIRRFFYKVLTILSQTEL